jgi:hypothetical protein
VLPAKRSAEVTTGLAGGVAATPVSAPISVGGVHQPRSLLLSAEIGPLWFDVDAAIVHLGDDPPRI